MKRQIPLEPMNWSTKSMFFVSKSLNFLCFFGILESPTIHKGGTEQVVEGKVALLECAAYGEPPPLVTWQRNGVRVETGLRYVVDESVLKIIDTRSSDSGIYVCVATNEAGTDQQAFTLEVLSKIVIHYYI